LVERYPAAVADSLLVGEHSATGDRLVEQVSMPKTRFRRCDQVIEARLSASVGSSAFAVVAR